MTKRLLVKVENISKSFGSREILNNINFEIHKGDIIGFLGLSGSGKSTLLNMISGFLKPSCGNIYYHSKAGDLKSIYLDSSEFKSVIGFSSQKPSFYPELSIYENMVYYGILCDVDRNFLEKKIEEILKLLDLDKFKTVLGKNLSEGMKKRLDLACSLVHGPQILILDEPTSNLDFRLREEILHYVKKINQKQGITILFVSHFIDEIEMICSKVLMINYSCEFLESFSRLKVRFENFINKEKTNYSLNPTNLTEVKNE